MLAAVHYQLGSVLVRTGRVNEAIEAFRTSRELQPDSAEGARSLAEALLRAGDVEGAAEQADVAVALAERDEDPGTRASAHDMAARVALARKDPDAAVAHAEAAEAADPTMPVLALVRARIRFDEGNYEDAVAELQQAARDGEEHDALPELHLTLGEALVRLERYEDAERQFREELIAFPRNLQAYSNLVMLYRAMNRDADVELLLTELVATTPTPEGYAVAARLWTVLGDARRAEALKSDARTRFRGDPSLALLGVSGRR
jgi:Flp pilus assembly protein TadD